MFVLGGVIEFFETFFPKRKEKNASKRKLLNTEPPPDIFHQRLDEGCFFLILELGSLIVFSIDFFYHYHSYLRPHQWRIRIRPLGCLVDLLSHGW